MTLIFISFFTTLLITLKNDKIAEILTLYDNPDNNRKTHKNKVALTGGIIIFANILIIIIYLSLNFDDLKTFSVFESKKDFIIFSFSTILFFLIGFFDDKYNISANFKFLIMLGILIPTVLLSDNLIIQEVQFSFSDKILKLPFHIAVFWTALCFLLFLNALNMFDGINYQVGIYSIYICIFFILNNFFTIFFILILISLLFFLYLNHFNKAFLGDSGSILLAFLFSYFFIKFYNQINQIKTDQIVLFMLIPGLDLMRLFITRIYKGKLPFSPDRNHLHHILQSKNNLIITNLKTFLLIAIPSAFGFVFGFTYFLIIIQCIIYFLLIKKN